jgi:signal transduction histidine kinase
VLVRLSRQGGAAVISVSDTGCGMSEEFRRKRLFRPFVSTKPSGMGIGAYEVQQYVQELGGRIEVESREKVGSTFRIVLPSAAPEAAGTPKYATEDSE